MIESPPKPLVETATSNEQIHALPLLDRVMAFTIPGAPLHSMLACALDKPCLFHAKYHGKVSVTSDGYAMCDFESDSSGYRVGAFVNSFSSIKQNVKGLLDHMQERNFLTPAERIEVLAVIQGWIGQDYSGTAKFV